jgi:hypothetical protein
MTENCLIKDRARCFGKLEFSRVQSSSVEFSSVQSSSVEFSRVQFSSVQFSPVQSSSVEFSSLQFTQSVGGGEPDSPKRD